MRKKELKRLRALYYILFALVIFSISFIFFSSDVRLANEEGRIQRQMKERLLTNKSTYLKSSYLRYARKPNKFDIPIKSNPDSNIVVMGRVNTFDAIVEFTDASMNKSGHFIISFVLILLSNLSLIAIFVLLGVLFYSLRKSIRQGKVFAKRDVKVIRIIALLLITASVSSSLSMYFEHLQIASYLKGTEWVPLMDFPFSFFEIIFGIVILFLSECFSIAYRMQEDQELTI